MDNVGIVVEDINAAVEFFTELGLELEGRATVEGDWADGVTGMHGIRAEIAMMRTPDGHGRIELSRFLAPPVVADHRSAPVNAFGYLRVMFTVEDIDETLALSANAARRSSARFPGTGISIGCVTSGALEGYSSDLRSSSIRRPPERIRCNVSSERSSQGRLNSQARKTGAHAEAERLAARKHRRDPPIISSPFLSSNMRFRMVNFTSAGPRIALAIL
jgi:catechol 2,3-dioxygenase-like lactoylglutathione lyase family enzyme